MFGKPGVPYIELNDCCGCVTVALNPNLPPPSNGTNALLKSLTNASCVRITSSALFGHAG